ncbi:MAG TPA: tetratricopeptide repeat protein, partial [Vicinamibacterales bacterium]|nr:tetratricopeptide repeat protein [Vicinamibacterales bacterium]
MSLARRVAALMAAVALTGASGAAQSSGTPSARPSLPYQVRLELRESQSAVARAIAAPQSVADWATVIDAATRVVTARTTHQGAEWWETVDARLQLADVRTLAELSPDVRQSLGRVYEQLSGIDARRSALLASQDPAALGVAIDELGRAGATLTSAFGAEHRSVARVKRRVAALDVARGQPQAGERVYLEARDSLKQLLGPGHPEYASVLQELGILYVGSGRLSEAEPVLGEALKIRRDTVREGDRAEQMAYADTVMWLGVLSATLDRLADAEKRFVEAANAYERIAESGAYATAQIRLADVYASMGRTEEAKARYATARRWQPKSAPVIFGHAAFLLSVGDLDAAQATCNEGLELIDDAGRRGLVYAQALDVLAGIDRARARFPSAASRYSQALDLQVAALGATHPDALTTISKRASVRTLMGAYAQAEEDYQRALEGFAATLGTANLSYGVTLNELAVLHQYRKPTPDYTRALENYLKARDIFQAVVGTNHTTYITALHNLGAVHHALADTGPPADRASHQAEAERFYAETRALLKDRAATQPALYATVLDNSARLSASMHHVDEATAFAEEASGIRLELYGRDHPAVAASLSTRALILVEGKQLPAAASLLLQSTRSEWAHVTRSLPALTDDQKRLFLRQTEFTQADRLWTLVFEQAQSAAEGLEAVLLRKHLLFEATRQESGAFRAVVSSASKEWQQLWAERNALRQRYAEGVLHGAPDDVIRQLSLSLDAIEARLRREHPAYDRQARLNQISIDDLIKTLKPSEAIVEIVAYRRFDFAAGSFDAQPTYGAIVLRAGASPAAVRLGPSQEIDALVRDYRGEMQKWIEAYKAFSGEISPARARRSELALASLAEGLSKKVWSPITTLLGGATRIYLAPDGALGLLPFEALVAPDAADLAYLGEKIEFVYLPASRDLGRFRLAAAAPSANTAVIVGHPDFDMPAPAGAAGPAADSSASCRYTYDKPWGDAPGLTPFVTSAHRVLTTLNWNVTSLVDRDAIEGTVLAARAPRLLQFATHGYFLDCGEGALDTPLAQSLLILAGAN